jgi:hypothetical protein
MSVMDANDTEKHVSKMPLKSILVPQKSSRIMHSGMSLKEFFDSLTTTIISFHAIIEYMSLMQFRGECLEEWIDIRKEYIVLNGFLETFVPHDVTILKVFQDEKLDCHLGTDVLEKVKYINAFEKCKNLLLKITTFFEKHLNPDTCKNVNNRIAFGTIIGSTIGTVCAQLFGTKYCVVGLIAFGIYGSFCYSQIKTEKKRKECSDNVCSKILENILFMETNMSEFLDAFDKIKAFKGYQQMYHIFDHVIPSLENLSNVSKDYVLRLK